MNFDGGNVSAIATAGASLFVALFGVVFGEYRFRRQHRTEKSIGHLLEITGWEQRSFEEIKKKIGGFEDDNELRRLLVRAGAIRFLRKDGTEFWGLLSRNKKKLERDA